MIQTTFFYPADVITENFTSVYTFRIFRSPSYKVFILSSCQQIFFFVSHILSAPASWVFIIFSLSNLLSSREIRISFISTIRFTIGINPHRIPMSRHFMPIWADVRYTRTIPPKKMTPSTAITQRRSPSHLPHPPEKMSEKRIRSHRVDADTEIRK